MHLHPQGGENFFRHNVQEKFVSAPQDAKCTPGRARVNFYDIFAGRVRFGGSSFRLSFEGDD